MEKSNKISGKSEAARVSKSTLLEISKISSHFHGVREIFPQILARLMTPTGPGEVVSEPFSVFLDRGSRENRAVFEFFNKKIVFSGEKMSLPKEKWIFSTKNPTRGELAAFGGSPALLLQNPPPSRARRLRRLALSSRTEPSEDDEASRVKESFQVELSVLKMMSVAQRALPGGRAF